MPCRHRATQEGAASAFFWQMAFHDYNIARHEPSTTGVGRADRQDLRQSHDAPLTEHVSGRGLSPPAFFSLDASCEPLISQKGAFS